ncbi:MAG TPA: hypothetical protein VG815_02140 [Chloroflexota bacterium]|jgi:hypothetical protein|nr:hypothetical protein [Chloroflexota bacterium]
MIRDQPRFRRHEGACPFYRENWITSDGRTARKGETTLYEIYCLRDTPPETIEEQRSCMLSGVKCWRDEIPHRTVVLRERRRQAEEAAAKAS